MNYRLIKVTSKDKLVLFNLLQFSLYDGSMHINNEIGKDGLFKYKWFDNYFTDSDRIAYLIKDKTKLLGMVLINENLKYLKTGKCIAEFLILPQYRRHHIGKQVAYEIFDKYKVEWEVEPMDNNPIAYNFWKNIISEYTNNNYVIKKHNTSDVFIFKSNKI